MVKFTIGAGRAPLPDFTIIGAAASIAAAFFIRVLRGLGEPHALLVGQVSRELGVSALHRS